MSPTTNDPTACDWALFDQIVDKAHGPQLVAVTKALFKRNIISAKRHDIILSRIAFFAARDATEGGSNAK